MYKRINELLGTKYKSDSEINWGWLSIRKTLSEDFIREFKDKVDWEEISFYQTLSESFIREFKDYVDWKNISCSQILSEHFIKEFQNMVDWGWISNYQTFSEDFIKEFQDKIEWNNLLRSIPLNFQFILNFKNKINWETVSKYQPFIDPDYKKIDKYQLEIFNKFYHCYSVTKDRGWFWGYIYNKKIMLYDINLYKGSIPKSRVIIFWNNLNSMVTLRTCKNLTLLRNIKYVGKSNISKY